MKRKLAVILSALILAAVATFSGNLIPEKSGNTEILSSEEQEGDTEKPADDAEKTDVPVEIPTEPPTEAPTEHISPVETVTAELGIQQNINVYIGREHGSNTVNIPLADFIREGDRIKSFIFTIYSSDGYDIGQFKGGCGVDVSEGCPDANSENWYQTPDFYAPTEGTYGEITWNVPDDVSDYITPEGNVMFGYWWGGASGLRVENVVCNITRTADIPCDGTVDIEVNKSVNFNAEDNTIHVPHDILPEGAIPQSVTYKISSGGGFGKFTGAFGYSSSKGEYMSGDVSEFTDSSDISLTWIIEPQAKNYFSEDGELILGYWWSEQAEATLDSVEIKYSLGGSTGAASAVRAEKPQNSVQSQSYGFRSSEEIVKDIKVGWNLGNSLESYNTDKKGLATEMAWGNPKVTEELVKSVKNAGFNAIRVPVTWGEHMDGDIIQQEWLGRVKEVVDYVYDNDMYVIINMHHDDYIWFNPTEAEYSGDSAKFKKIWAQIADYFKDYGDRLIFEGMNEARTIGSVNEWMGGTAAERAIVNKYVQDFVDVIRASGGKNTERSLIISAYGACAEEVAMNDVIVPDDKNLIVSIHYYAPWRFASGETTSFGQSEKTELSRKFDSMKNKFIDKGTPLIIAEFGCVGIADDTTRSEYYSYYISTAKERGIKCFVWDNNIFGGDEGYGILNRTSMKWNDTLLAGIISGAK
ncbi:MAG: cellulase family glycosylhydrolase [Ruminococcus sp.]|nr:cellulase family glycosylhydrolase [Ruminococcus sp.]